MLTPTYIYISTQIHIPLHRYICTPPTHMAKLAIIYLCTSIPISTQEQILQCHAPPQTISINYNIGTINMDIFCIFHNNTLSEEPKSPSPPTEISSVTWSTTERGEIRNFPYPSVFELTGRQRLIIKKRNRNVGQFLVAEVTNPGQNESQQMFALCDRREEERG